MFISRLLTLILLFNTPIVLSANVLPKLDISGTQSSYITITSIKLSGNTVFERHEVTEMVSGLINKLITTKDITNVVNKITNRYRELGYSNSFVVAPNQDLSTGVLTLVANEGMISNIAYTGDKGLTKSLLENTLMPAMKGVMNINKINKALMEIKSDTRIQSINATLISTNNPRYNDILVTIKENNQFYGSIEVNNYQSPYIGSEGITLNVGKNNISGTGDAIFAMMNQSSHSTVYSLIYQLPVVHKNSAFTTQILSSKNNISSTVLNKVAPGFNSSLGGTVQVFNFNWFYKVNKQRDWIDGINVTLENFQYASLINDNEEYNSNSSSISLGFNKKLKSKILFTKHDLVIKYAFSGTEHLKPLKEKNLNYSLINYKNSGQTFVGLKKYSLQFKLDSQFALSSLPRAEKKSITGHSKVKGYHEGQFSAENFVVVNAALEHRFSGKVAANAFIGAGVAYDQSTNEKALSTGIEGKWAPIKNWISSASIAVPLTNQSKSVNNLQDYGINFSVAYKFL